MIGDSHAAHSPDFANHFTGIGHTESRRQESESIYMMLVQQRKAGAKKRSKTRLQGRVKLGHVSEQVDKTLKVSTTKIVATAKVVLLSILIAVLISVIHAVCNERTAEHTGTEAEGSTTCHAHATTAAAAEATTSHPSTCHHRLLSVHRLLGVCSVPTLLRICAVLRLSAVGRLLIVLLRWWLLTPSATIGGRTGWGSIAS